MKVTFKDLKQQKFSVEIDPSEPVSALKQKVFEERGWDPKQQKLIYSGKILKDEDTVESYKIEEKGFVVCVVNKAKEAKPAPAAATTSAKEPATPAQATSSTPAPPPVQAQTSTAPAAPPATPTPARAPESQAGGATFSDPNVLTVGAQRAEVIANMEAMGFERLQIDAAMRAAFYNPDRAVDYLLNGIPENLQQSEPAAARQSQAAQAAAETAADPATEGEELPPVVEGEEGEGEGVNLFDLAAQQGRGGAGGARGAAGGASAGAAAGGQAAMGNLNYLRNNTQFQQLRQLVQQQPQMLETILQQLSAGNPQLATMISSNPEQFLNLLAEAADDDVPPPPGAQSIPVTEEERDAIERLCRLGFDREMAIQAYFACDKNEELAANFLFEADEEDDNQPQT